MIRSYFILTKPGILLGNLITTGTGFILASRGQLEWSLFFLTIFGLFLVIASACVFNNFIDIETDAKMERTKNRAFVTGLISEKRGLIFAISLGSLGFILLLSYTNYLTTFIAGIGFFIYVFVYTIWKRSSTYATHLGSMAGAVPPIVGYCAVSNSFDLAAFTFFMVVVFWQIPHFLAIAIYHIEDYAAATIPVFPLQKGISHTKQHMFFYLIAFIVSTLMLSILGFTGKVSFFVSFLLGLSWLLLSVMGFKAKNDKIWARQMFLYSLLVIVGLCMSISFDSIFSYLFL